MNISPDHHLQERVKKYQRVLEEKQTPSDEIIGSSSAINKIRDKILKSSKRNDPILILGECGVGKNMIAESIHKNSHRPGKFVYIQCTSISTNITESELFGHEKWAFTDAKLSKKGLFEEANGGTVFLDEIGDLPAELQGKLLHFFDQKTIRHVGGNKDIKLDVRVICATNKNLEEEVACGRFRKDLYHRIAGFRIDVPPLRERKEDIKELVKRFYIRYCTEFNKDTFGIAEDALDYLQGYEWPGNVRELENTIKRCIDELENGQMLTKECLKQSLVQCQSAEQQPKPQDIPEQSDDLRDEMRNLTLRVEKLEGRPVDKRLSNHKKALNELFLVIQQEKKPLRKTHIIERCPHLKKSFHHWINTLVDKYHVVEIEKHPNFLLYKLVENSVLEAKKKEGKLIKGDGGYYQLA